MTRPVAVFLLSVLLVGTGASSVAAQQPADSARAKAERDFHGPDGTGKDGPLSAAGMDLLLLYHRFREAESREAFAPAQSGLQVSDGHVTVDAIAREEAEQLRSDLEQLGMKNTAVAGRVVSGRLPIEQIPEAARLETLRGLMGARAETRSPSSPSPSGAPAAPEVTDSTESDDQQSEESTGVGALLLLAVSGLVLLLIEEF